MQNSPLQLDDIFIGQVTIKPCDLPPATSDQPNRPAVWTIRADPSYSRNVGNALNWRVELSVDFRATEKEYAPYEGRIDCEGYFTVVDVDLPEEKQQKLVAVNAPSI